MKVTLTIAGSDSSGGAGLQADIKTFEAHHVFGASVVTAVTAQNTVDVSAVYALPPEIVLAQLEAVFIDLPIAAVKIGMLANVEIVQVVAQFLANVTVPIVLDPVLYASTGAQLLEPAAVELLKARLLPLSTIFTPNILEAELLAERDIHSWEDARAAAAIISAYSQDAFILVKGGHLPPSPDEEFHLVSDLLYKNGEYHRLDAPYIASGNTHGTGCTLSAAIAANLALGLAPLKAVKLAKEYVTDAIRLAPHSIGHGAGPLRHNFEHLR